MKREYIYFTVGVSVIIGIFAMFVGILIGKEHQKDTYMKSAVAVLDEAKEIGEKADLQMKHTATYLKLAREYMDSITIKETVYSTVRDTVYIKK